jgi:hypothetical protein
VPCFSFFDFFLDGENTAPQIHFQTTHEPPQQSLHSTRNNTQQQKQGKILEFDCALHRVGFAWLPSFSFSLHIAVILVAPLNMAPLLILFLLLSGTLFTLNYNFQKGKFSPSLSFFVHE